MKELCFVFLFQQYFFQYYVAKQLSVILKNDALRTFFSTCIVDIVCTGKKRTTCVIGRTYDLRPQSIISMKPNLFAIP